MCCKMFCYVLFFIKICVICVVIRQRLKVVVGVFCVLFCNQYIVLVFGLCCVIFNEVWVGLRLVIWCLVCVRVVVRCLVLQLRLSRWYFGVLFVSVRKKLLLVFQWLSWLQRMMRWGLWYWVCLVIGFVLESCLCWCYFLGLLVVVLVLCGVV